MGYTRLFVNRRKIYKNSMEISEMNNKDNKILTASIRFA